MPRVTHAGVAARLLLAKNPAGWAELLDLLDGGKEPVVIGINARVADGHDPSWLWDVDFERLGGRLVVATGERRRDLAVRLRYAGVAHMTVADQLEALGAPVAASVDYVGNYTAFQDLRRRLAGHRAGGTLATPIHPPRCRRAMPDRPTSWSAPSTFRRRRSPAPRTAAPAPDRTRRAPSAGPSALRVVVIYPDLLGTYGDGGNGRVLATRAAWRGIPGGAPPGPVRHGPAPRGGSLLRRWGRGRSPDPGGRAAGRRKPDGGGDRGRHRPGRLCRLPDHGDRVPRSRRVSPPRRGPARRDHGEGIGPPRRGRDRDRAVGRGPRRGQDPPGARLVRCTGFENHAGVTTLGPSAQPFARVISGTGNAEGSGTDGAWVGRVVGTYMHGPVLARNPALADMLLALATGAAPAPLDDEEEEALHHERLHLVSVRGGLWSGGIGPRWRRLSRAAPVMSATLVTVAFSAAAGWFASTVVGIGDGQWERPGLGVWTVRELVGHTGRAFVTVEEYSRSTCPDHHELPPGADDDPVGAAGLYFLATHGATRLHAEVAARGRQAGIELGPVPTATVSTQADRVVALVRGAPASAVFVTRFGVQPFATYLCTRVVELVVHTLDICDASALAPDIPDPAARLTLAVATETARAGGSGPALLRALGGRAGLPAGFTVFG